MKTIITLIITAGILFSILACSGTIGYNNYLASTPEQAIMNESEKEKVLLHYAQSGDSLKKKAAMFLIEHIAAHYTHENKTHDRFRQALNELDVAHTNYATIFPLISSVWDSISGTSDAADIPPFSARGDETLISAKFLIRNIESAFDAWKEHSGSFSDFCEYVLPYRVMHEPPGFDRDFFREKFSGRLSGFHPVKHHGGMDVLFPHLMDIGLSYKLGIGNCVQQAISETMILRSAGIPATVDYVPHWGNYDGKHYISKRLSDADTLQVFDLSLSDFKQRIPEDSLPEGFSAVRYNKTIPKVYRMTWSGQEERIVLNTAGGVERTGLFANLYEKDVTDEYTPCSQAMVRVNCPDQCIVYLCVFDRDGWMPVCASLAHNNEVVFDKIGRETVYLPARYAEDARGEWYMQPVGDPFYFTADGVSVPFCADSRSKRRVRLYAKYPLHSYTVKHAYNMKGGMFQGANRSDFSDADTLYTITYYPFYKQEIELSVDKTYRFFRYLAPGNAPYSFSELRYYTRDDRNDAVSIDGFHFDPYRNDTITFAALSDNDLDTYTTGLPVKENWIGYDTGERSGSQLTRIVFSPRNDGNCIIPGYLYELFYWGNHRWISMGVKTANHHFLEYDNIPRNALFVLKCYTKGKEERIFSIENGKQIWW